MKNIPLALASALSIAFSSPVVDKAIARPTESHSIGFFSENDMRNKYDCGGMGRGSAYCPESINPQNNKYQAVVVLTNASNYTDALIKIDGREVVLKRVSEKRITLKNRRVMIGGKKQPAPMAISTFKSDKFTMKINLTLISDANCTDLEVGDMTIQSGIWTKKMKIKAGSDHCA